MRSYKCRTILNTSVESLRQYYSLRSLSYIQSSPWWPEACKSWAKCRVMWGIDCSTTFGTALSMRDCLTMSSFLSKLNGHPVVSMVDPYTLKYVTIPWIPIKRFFAGRSGSFLPICVFSGITSVTLKNDFCAPVATTMTECALLMSNSFFSAKASRENK